MTILKSAHGRNKVKFLVLIKIVSFIILSCIYQYNKDENAIRESLENGRKLNITLYMRTHRTLAKYKKQDELINTKFQYKIDDNTYNHKLVHRRVNNHTYEQLKRGRPNNVESYLNSFKYRHSKKNGLKKLDCYYEKKLFTVMDKIEKHVEQKNISNKQINEIIFKRFGLFFILLCSIPLLTFALPKFIIWKKYKMKTRVIIKCTDGKGNTQDIVLSGIRPNFDSTLRYIFLVISVFMVMLIIIYMYIKILKYKRIKAGMLK